MNTDVSKKVAVQNKNSKMGRVLHVSLPPVASCPVGVPCTDLCYAMKAVRQYPLARAAWANNFEIWKNTPAKYELDICMALSRSKCKLFRWHMAGDLKGLLYLDMMCRIARLFPDISFLCFTKNYSTMAYCDFPLPDNLSVILSAWPGHTLVNPNNLPVAWVQDGTETRIPKGTPECSGRCDTCSICWGMREGGVFFHKH